LPEPAWPAWRSLAGRRATARPARHKHGDRPPQPRPSRCADQSLRLDVTRDVECPVVRALRFRSRDAIIRLDLWVRSAASGFVVEAALSPWLPLPARSGRLGSAPAGTPKRDRAASSRAPSCSPQAGISTLGPGSGSTIGSRRSEAPGANGFSCELQATEGPHAAGACVTELAAERPPRHRDP
jgi:hypothetical protein